MGRWVLLKHSEPDGRCHLDWMLEQSGTDRLLTFRLAEGVDVRSAAEFDAERIADHRPMYLEYEGPISGGRGEVRRLAEGTCRLSPQPGGPLSIEIPDAGRRLIGRKVPGATTNRWRFELA